MKKILSAVFLSVIFFIGGCSHNEQGPTYLYNGKPINILKLPSKTSLHTENTFYTSKVIDGSIGGTLIINANYQSDSGLVHINCRLQIPHGSFSGMQTLSAQVDDEYAMVDFSPTMNFSKQLKLDLIFSGLDLSGVDPGQVDFIYELPDGSIQTVQYSELDVDNASGTVLVKDAIITHFSRYIFIRKQF
jgi:hypothetical protein